MRPILLVVLLLLPTAFALSDGPHLADVAGLPDACVATPAARTCTFSCAAFSVVGVVVAGPDADAVAPCGGVQAACTTSVLVPACTDAGLATAADTGECELVGWGIAICYASE